MKALSIRTRAELAAVLNAAIEFDLAGTRRGRVLMKYPKRAPLGVAVPKVARHPWATL